MAENVKDAAGKAASEAKAEGAEILGQARDRAEGLVEEGKAQGADQAKGFARAIHHAADDLEDSSPDIAKHVRAAGDSISGIADALRERSAGQLLEDVNDFARRQPTLFFGAAALAGFALVRFAKSSAKDQPGDTSQHRGSTSPERTRTTTPQPPRPAPMPAGSLAGDAARPGETRPAHSPAPSAGSPPAPGLSAPTVRSGSVPNEKSGSPL